MCTGHLQQLGTGSAWAAVHCALHAAACKPRGHTQTCWLHTWWARSAYSCLAQLANCSLSVHCPTLIGDFAFAPAATATVWLSELCRSLPLRVAYAPPPAACLQASLRHCAPCAGLLDKLKTFASKRKMEDGTLGPVITWTTDGMLGHVDKLTKIPGGGCGALRHVRFSCPALAH